MKLLIYGLECDLLVLVVEVRILPNTNDCYQCDYGNPMVRNHSKATNKPGFNVVRLFGKETSALWKNFFLKLISLPNFIGVDLF